MGCCNQSAAAAQDSGQGAKEEPECRVVPVTTQNQPPDPGLGGNHRYELGEYIAKGSYSEVFHATDKDRPDLSAVVKKCPKKDAGNTEMLYGEMAILSELRHPHVCSLIDNYEHDDCICMVLEHCDGGEFFEEIFQANGIQESRCADVIAQVSAVIRFAHSRRIIHRDIKPENVMLMSAGGGVHVKMVDWGLSTFHGYGAVDQRVGSEPYAAPEILESTGRESYSSLCDLWSLGVLVYVALCAKPPFWHEWSERIKRMKSGQYPMSADPWPSISSEAKSLIESLLMYDPQERLPIAEVVHHPWLSGRSLGSQSSVNLTGGCVDEEFERYHKVQGLRACISSGAVAFLKGSFVIQLWRDGGRMERRQDLPSSAFWSPEECLRFASRPGYMGGEDFLHALSYAWLEPGHPDTMGHHLRIVAAVLEKRVAYVQQYFDLEDIGLFWDFPSLHQRPRSDEQQVLFDEGLSSANLIYGHRLVTVLLQTQMPKEIELREYSRRGWCVFERAVSGIIKDFTRLLDIGVTEDCAQLPDWFALQDACTAQRAPPLTPAALAERLRSAPFTNGRSEELKVAGLYRSTFEAVAGAAKALDFRTFGWGAEDIGQLADALQHFRRCEKLDLRGNPLGDDGLRALQPVFPQMESLQEVWLVRTGGSTSAKSAVQEAWASAGKQRERAYV